jgi:peroxiredoxin
VRALRASPYPSSIEENRTTTAWRNREGDNGVAIEVGESAPVLDSTLTDAEGTPRDLAAALTAGPLLLGLYKCSCQASKTIFPFLERLHQRYAADGLTVYGVAQDSDNITRSFARRLELTFPILVEGNGYPLSRAFDIAATPTVYLIRPDGTVSYTTMGFFKQTIDDLGDAVAAAIGRDPEPLVTEADDVPLFVPG